MSSDSGNTTVQYEPDALALVKAHIEDFGRAVRVDGLMAVQVTEAMVESASTRRNVMLEPLLVSR